MVASAVNKSFLLHVACFALSWILLLEEVNFIVASHSVGTL